MSACVGTYQSVSNDAHAHAADCSYCAGGVRCFLTGGTHSTRGVAMNEAVCRPQSQVSTYLIRRADVNSPVYLVGVKLELVD
jgi:hypothetical protein